MKTETVCFMLRPVADVEAVKAQIMRFARRFTKNGELRELTEEEVDSTLLLANGCFRSVICEPEDASEFSAGLALYADAFVDSFDPFDD